MLCVKRYFQNLNKLVNDNNATRVIQNMGYNSERADYWPDDVYSKFEKDLNLDKGKLVHFDIKENDDRVEILLDYSDSSVNLVELDKIFMFFGFVNKFEQFKRSDFQHFVDSSTGIDMHVTTTSGPLSIDKYFILKSLNQTDISFQVTISKKGNSEFLFDRCLLTFLNRIENEI